MEGNSWTRLPSTFAVIGALFASAYAIAGCTDAPSEGPDYLVEGDLSEETKKSDPGRLDPANEQGEASPVTLDEGVPGGELAEGPSGEAPMEGDGGAGMDGGDAGDAAAPKPPAPTAPTAVTKSQSCTSRYGSHSSVTKLTWTVTGGTQIKIKSMTVLVKNSSGRSANDVDVYIRPPGGAEYLSWNSGDILANGRTVTVPYRASTTPKANTKIRILTNFDQPAGDPYASCTITVR